MAQGFGSLQKESAWSLNPATASQRKPHSLATATPPQTEALESCPWGLEALLWVREAQAAVFDIRPPTAGQLGLPAWQSMVQGSHISK